MERSDVCIEVLEDITATGLPRHCSIHDNVNEVMQKRVQSGDREPPLEQPEHGAHDTCDGQLVGKSKALHSGGPMSVDLLRL